MPNLAQELQLAQGLVVPFPKKERLMMTGIEEGYTKLPNLLIDSEIMADLSDKAFKCLMFIVRQTIGFGRNSHTISITQFQKYCGIKKEETVTKVIRELEQCNAIKVERKSGCLNEYFLTLNQYQQTVLPPSKGGSPIRRGESTHAVGGESTPIKQGTIKERLNKTLNKEKKAFPVDKSESKDLLDSIEYHHDNAKAYSLRELSREYPVLTDFPNQAKSMNDQLSDEQIKTELKNFAQWSMGQKERTAQLWMNAWIYRIEKLKTKKTTKVNTAPKAKKLSEPQIEYFASKLTNHHEFASMYSEPGEQQKSFIIRVSSKLRDPNTLKQWATYLHDVGFVGDLGAFHD